MVGGAVLIVIVLIIVLISGGGGSSEKPIALKRLVGQTIVAKLSAKGPNQDLIKRVRKGQVGGVIAFETDAQQAEGGRRGNSRRRRAPGTTRRCS